MADVRVVPNVVLSDPTTPSQIAAVDSSGRVSVSLTASSATVTVDTELPTAGALSDAFANPTTTNVGSMNMVYNGSTWDRLKESVTALDSTGTGIPTAGIVGQLDDVSTTTVTENQFAHVRISSRRALLIEGVASGTVVPVSLASTTVTGTVTVDTELPTAAALADATANPTIPSVGSLLLGFNGTTWDRVRTAATLADALANPGTGLLQSQNFLMGYNGTTWDRVRTANTGRLQVDVVTGGGSNASVLVDNAGFTDGTSSVTGVGYIFDEVAGTALTENDIAAARIDSKRAQVHVIEDATTRGQRLAVDSSGRASVSITASSATVTVDSELPAAAALADATSNPTVPGVGGFLMGYNGTTWDRVRTANTGRLQVDVVTGGGGSSAPTTPINDYATASATAAGSSTNHDTADFGAATKRVWGVEIGASVPGKWILQYVDNSVATTLAVFWTAAGESKMILPPHPNFWAHTFTANAGVDSFRVVMQNMDASEAADMYSTIFYGD